MPFIPNTLHLFCVATLATAICSGCASTSYDSPNTLGVMPPRPPTPLWLGAIQGSGSTQIRGAAAVTPSQTPGWAHVLLSLDNSNAGAIYTWSLHSGSCAAQGSVVGPANRYTELAINADGTGAAEAVIPTTLSPSDSYAVVATPASPGAAATNACANLTRASM